MKTFKFIHNYTDKIPTQIRSSKDLTWFNNLEVSWMYLQGESLGPLESALELLMLVSDCESLNRMTVLK
jgi:hypothetical protein